MRVLDTNVVSETMRAQPHAAVLAWLDAHGVAAMLEQDFAGQVLPFDLAAASVYADLVAQRERSGKPIGMADAQIAATCLVHQATWSRATSRTSRTWA